MKVIYYEYGIDKTTANNIENNNFDYGGKIIEIEYKYCDCVFADFDNNGFNIDKYNSRKQMEKDNLRIAEIKPRLEQLSQDIVQSLAGAEFEDLAERQKEFKTLHNELRVLLGKEPRKYLEVDNETNN